MTTQPFTFAESVTCPNCGGVLQVDGVIRHLKALVAAYHCDSCGCVLIIPNAPQIKASAAKSVGDGSMRPVLVLLQSEQQIVVPAGFAHNGGN